MMILQKFNKFIYYPDLSNKFLHESYNNVLLSKNFYIYLKYVFSQRKPYNYIAIKGLLMLSSVFPKRCLMTSKLIIVKYTKTRCHSEIHMKLLFHEFVQTMQFNSINPIPMNTNIHSHIKQSKYFVFPGFIKHLRLPRWEYNVIISYKQVKNENLYPLFFHKTSLIA